MKTIIGYVPCMATMRLSKNPGSRAASQLVRHMRRTRSSAWIRLERATVKLLHGGSCGVCLGNQRSSSFCALDSLGFAWANLSRTH